MRTWPSRGGIRCAICSRCTSRSGSSSAPTRPAGRRRSTSTRTATEFVLTAELPGLSRDQIEIHAEDNRIVIRGARASGRPKRCPMRAVSSRRARSRPLLACLRAAGSDRRRTRVAADLKDGLLTVTIPKAAGRGVHRAVVDSKAETQILTRSQIDDADCRLQSSLLRSAIFNCHRNP